jgi:hypothetical protein
MTNDGTSELAQCIEAIEAGYEFMLAYAAQGYEAGQAGNHSHDILKHLTGMDDALTRLSDAVAEVTAADGSDVAQYQSFLTAIDDDASKSQGAVRLVLSRQGVSSQLIDNLNASIHLRALLTDLFLLDEAF